MILFEWRADRGGCAYDGGVSVFELSGGAACLDFVNTVEGRPGASPRERLASYADLLDWARQAGLLGEGQARALASEARGHPRRAEAALARGRALREALFGVFSAAAGGRDPAAADLGTLNEALSRALARRRLRVEGACVAWAWDEGAPALDRPLWPVAVAAAELLVSPALERVRECAAGGCAWLFLDHSRNRSRRWCDMAVCGNRDKARRHRARRRGPA